MFPGGWQFEKLGATVATEILTAYFALGKTTCTA